LEEEEEEEEKEKEEENRGNFGAQSNLVLVQNMTIS